MQQISHSIGKAHPKSHSHGISTPTVVTHLGHIVSSSPKPQGSVMNVPKHLIKSSAMRDTPVNI